VLTVRRTFYLGMLDRLFTSLNDLKAWYDRNAAIYRPLPAILEKMIKGILDKEAVECILIQARLKTFESFEEKIVRNHSDNPEKVRDMVGVMIVGSVLSNAELISRVVKRNKEFEIDWDNSEDHSIKLAKDRVGYRGKNYLTKFRKDAFENSTEYTKFKDLRFEIQIKTLLDFSWGKIEHDRNYKTAEELPEKSDVRRRFKLAAGALELIDNEFDRLSKETEKISDPMLNKIFSGDLSMEISPLSLRHFLRLHFNDIPGFREQFVAPISDLLNELSSMGLKTIADLNQIIKPDIKQFKDKYAQASKPKDYVSFSALIRDILILNDPDGYFKKAWKHHFNTLDYHCWKVYEKFGVDKTNFPHYPDLEFDEGGVQD